MCQIMGLIAVRGKGRLLESDVIQDYLQNISVEYVWGEWTYTHRSQVPKECCDQERDLLTQLTLVCV